MRSGLHASGRVTLSQATHRYVLPATNIVHVRVQWFQTGITLGFPWFVSVDQAQWRIRVR